MTVVVVQSILKQTLAEQVLRQELILVFVCNREGIQRDTGSRKYGVGTLLDLLTTFKTEST